MMQEHYHSQSREAVARSLWLEGGWFVAVERDAAEKYYCLCMPPYPSGRLLFTACLV
ncbi:MAG TPA: hypothetical protein VNI53_08710 [Gammaproteobacteria bacterium]|nr:hypothetical protein [Gammaproteobacteria bacterium]